MADEAVVNGRTLEISGSEDREEMFVDFDETDPKASNLMQKIDVLEQEKKELVQEKEVVRESINKLKREIERLETDKAELKGQIELSEADKRALDSIAARAAELEIQVSRLQHDLISASTEGEEANKEVLELKREVEELKKSDVERGEKLEVLEKERNLLLERIDKDGAEMWEEKEVREERVRELEKRLEGLGAEKAKIDEKENEIRKLKKNIEDLDSVITTNGVEMETMKKAREELENAKSELEGLLKKSEGRVKEMEEKMDQLHKELKDKRLDGLNGIPVVEDGEKGLDGLKLQWPVLAASTGLIVTIGALYYLRVRQR